eukprot:m51a1_g2164 hypothetical protein (203) ;mRNA; f:47861-48469
MGQQFSGQLAAALKGRQLGLTDLTLQPTESTHVDAEGIASLVQTCPELRTLRIGAELIGNDLELLGASVARLPHIAQITLIGSLTTSVLDIARVRGIVCKKNVNVDVSGRWASWDDVVRVLGSCSLFQSSTHLEVTQVALDEIPTPESLAALASHHQGRIVLRLRYSSNFDNRPGGQWVRAVSSLGWRLLSWSDDRISAVKK